MINNNVAQDNNLVPVESIYPAQYYLNLKSTNYNKWKERWECMLWEPKENYSHLPFEDFTLSEENDRGKFFKLNEADLHSPIKASEDEIEEASLWVIPGVSSTSRCGLSSTLKDLEMFFNGANRHLWQDKLIIFCPYSTGEDRYKQAMEHSNNQKEHYSLNIEKFVRKYLIPRLVKEKKLAFITYSIGGKELAMIENAARHILLNEYNYPITLVQKLFQSITAVCIGYATDIDNLPEIRFKKIVLLSASDQGLFIPQSLYYKMYKAPICNRPFTAFKVDKYETLIFLGHQASVEILDGKLNYDGHQLPHYFNAMMKKLPNTLLKYLHSLVFDNNTFNQSLEHDLEQLLEA